MSEGIYDIGGAINAEAAVATPPPAPRERRSKHREDRGRSSQSGQESTRDEGKEKAHDEEDPQPGAEQVGTPSAKEGNEKPRPLQFLDGKPNEIHIFGDDFAFFKERWGLFKPTDVTAPAWAVCLWRSRETSVRQSHVAKPLDALLLAVAIAAAAAAITD
jgi:hypothetical protein